MDVLATLAAGPVDELVEIQIGDRTAWTGLATSSKTISIYKRDLFGGEKREGGVEGQVDVMMGEPNMSINEYLGASMRASGITGPVPAYRGVCSLFFRGGTTNGEFSDSAEFTLIGSELPPVVPGATLQSVLPPAFRWVALNPYLKKFRAKVRRYSKAWYPAKARIGNDSNPIHIIYECLTNADWGMGYDTGNMDDARLRVAADVLFTENFGISLMWAQQSSIEDFVQLILRHINGVVNQDRATGKIFIKLVRKDYVPANLIALNPTNCRLDSYDRTGLGETVNEIALTYTTANGDEDTVTVQDLANITSQGQVISQAIDLPGLKNVDLAMRVAQRELNSRCAPISKLQLVCNRVAFQLYEGDVFKFSWPDLGITEAYYRVITMDLGTPESSEIQIDAVEDVFGLPNASYAKPQPTGWINPSVPPLPSPLRLLTETTYYDIARSVSATELAAIDETDSFVDVYAKAPSPTSYDYKLWTSVNPAAVAYRGIGEHTPITTLTAPLVKEEFSVIPLQSLSVLSGVEAAVNDLLLINGELMRLDALNVNNSTVTVARGVIDTVPKTHAAGSNVFFVSRGVGRDLINYLVGDTVNVKVQTRNEMGELVLSTAPQDQITLTGRQARPYPPAKVRINTAYAPAHITGAFSVSWVTRNRLTQTAAPIAQDFNSIAIESGVGTTIKITGESATLLTTTTSETSYELSIDAERAQSGVYDAGVGRELRLVGLSKVTNAITPNLSHDMQKVNGGWMRLRSGTVGNNESSRFIDSTTNAVTNRDFPTPWTTLYNFQMFEPNATVYQSEISYDSYAGWTIKKANNAPLDTSPTSALRGVDRAPDFIRDCRKTANSVIGITSIPGSLRYWVTTNAYPRIIIRETTVLHRLKRADLINGPMATTRTVVADLYRADMAQFDNPNTAHTSAPAVSSPGYNHRDSVIFGNLLYVIAPRVTATNSTSGKAVNITNALTSHLTIAAAIETATYQYSINSDGDIALLQTRSGAFIADQISPTVGVEIIGSSMRTVNAITGAQISVLGNLPGGSQVRHVRGDTSNSTYYVMANNSMLYHYSDAGVLLHSIAFPSYYNVDSVHLYVTSGFVYLTATNGYSFRYAKDLSTFSLFQLNKVVGQQEEFFGVARVTAYPDESQFLATNLIDEAGASTTVIDGATLRLNDTITVELGSTRGTLQSHTKQSFTVKRYGIGLRMGEYMG